MKGTQRRDKPMFACVRLKSGSDLKLIVSDFTSRYSHLVSRPFSTTAVFKPAT